MHRLFVMRHAKSSWNNASFGDHERPLAPRGRRAAAALADHVATLEPAPALVLCSTAKRAQDTLEPVRSRLPTATAVQIEDELYGASAPGLLDRLREVSDDTPSVLLVGHNPGLEDLVKGLGRDGDAELLARINAKFPTGALATLAFAGPWKSLEWGAATLEAFVVPADLQ
jgi:phosphohistidine phosphatase